MKFLYMCSLFFICRCLKGTNQDLDLTETAVYYDLKKHVFLRIISIENNLTNWLQLGDGTQRPTDLTFTKSKVILRRIGYRSNGCTCQQFICGCCVGINLNQLHFNREGCMNFTYSPYDFSVTMQMFMNNEPVFSESISAKDPPPLCIPIPVPYIPASIEFCGKLFDIHTPGQNIQMCFDFETKIQQSTILVLHFDCMRMGNDGISLVKPGDALPSTTDSQIDTDIFDEIAEIKY